MNFSVARKKALDQLVDRLRAFIDECEQVCGRRKATLALSQDGLIGWWLACCTLNRATALVYRLGDRDEELSIVGDQITVAIQSIFCYASRDHEAAGRLVVLHALYREAAREMNGILGAVVFGALDARLVK